jgi:hypothetical protein
MVLSATPAQARLFPDFELFNFMRISFAEERTAHCSEKFTVQSSKFKVNVFHEGCEPHTMIKSLPPFVTYG